MIADAGSKVIVLDRDGTLVIDRGYLADPAGLQFLPGTPEGLRRLHQLGYRLIVISNQSGVARGLLTPDTLRAIDQRLTQMVRDIGAELTAIYNCPHHPDDHCDCRKPQPGLLQQAARDWGFAPEDAIVIGDKASDIELGRALGARTMWVASSAAAALPPGVRADHVIANLQEAAGLIEQLQSASTTGR